MLNKVKLWNKNILDSCKAHKHIYLYGAGTYGKTFYHYLTQNGIKPDGFITTCGGMDYEGLKVYSADILPSLDRNCLVILSVREELQKEILSAQSFNCDLIQPTNLQISYIDTAMVINPTFFDASKREIKSKSNILIVQLEVTFGDMIWSTAFLRELKRNNPDADIDFIMNKNFVGLFENCPYITTIYEYDCSSVNDRISEAMVSKVKSYIKEFINKDYYAVFLPRLLPLSWSDAWENVLLAVHLGIPEIYGHALYILDDQKYRCDLLSDVLTGIARHTTAKHEAVNDLELLSLIGATVENNRMELWPKKKAYTKGRKSFKICVALVGSIPSRSWNPKHYGEVFKVILENYDDVEIILCGGKDAINAAETVEKMLNHRCVNLTGKTSLSDIVSIFADCDIYVGSDTGLMHIASAFNMYTIEISASNKTSPTYWGCTPTRTGPWCDRYVVLQPEKPLDDCKYMCFKPYAHCINQNTTEDVFNVLDNAIKSVIESKKQLLEVAHG